MRRVREVLVACLGMGLFVHCGSGDPFDDAPGVGGSHRSSGGDAVSGASGESSSQGGRRMNDGGAPASFGGASPSSAGRTPQSSGGADGGVGSMEAGSDLGAGRGGAAGSAGEGGASLGGAVAGTSTSGGTGFEPGPVRCGTGYTLHCEARPGVVGEGGGASQPHFPVARLDTGVFPRAINNQGQIVGSRRCCDGSHHAVLLADGVEVPLLEGFTIPGSDAVDINENGMIVGTLSSRTEQGLHTDFVPFTWADGVVTLLQEVGSAFAVAVNNRGQVLIRTEDDRGLIWEDDTVTDLGPNLVPYALNNHGDVVGYIQGSVPPSAFLWSDGLVTPIPELRSGTAINDSGLIAGLLSGSRGALWDAGTLTNLPSDPLAITADGAVLGGDWVYAKGVLTEFSSMWKGEELYSTQLADINDQQVVVGSGTLIDIVPGAFCGRLEACERLYDYPFVWSPGCFGSCCGEAREDGSGGAGGAGGAGGLDVCE